MAPNMTSSKKYFSVSGTCLGSITVDTVSQNKLSIFAAAVYSKLTV